MFGISEFFSSTRSQTLQRFWLSGFPNPFRRRHFSAIALSALPLFCLAAPATAIRLTPIGTFESGIFDESAAEIAAFDPLGQNIFVTNNAANRIDVLSASDPTNPTLNCSIDLNPFGVGVNSVAFHDGLLAVAVENAIAQEPGRVIFFDPLGGFLNSVVVGAIPDMVTFTPDGTKILVANEGEPNDDFSVDPEGSVSIIDLSSGANPIVTTAGLTQFNNAVLDDSVRIFGPGATVAQDLEPEFIAVSEDSSTAWVTLQENNAFGILDLTTGEFIDIVGLGFKDHSLPGNGLDASDEDGGINIANWPVLGMFQPDTIDTYSFGGETFIVSANEGDARDFEEERVEDLTLDPTAFPNADELQQPDVLGRLEVTNTLGDTDGDGDFDSLFAFGARSFSIWDADGNLVFDSGDDFEQITADLFPDFFNSDNDENTFDTRSDAKGPEPEAITIGQIDDRTFAFIGLERVGGIMTYDITDPFAPFFIDYVNNRNFFGDPELGTAGDLGPEGLLFIGATDSPTQAPLIIATNEVSGTTTLFAIEEESVPEPSTLLGLLGFGVLGAIARKGRNTMSA